MARPLDNEKRAQLLDAVVAYILEHGLADLSLRPLAKAIGTSARMLVHHFGTREALLRAAIEAIRTRADSLFRKSMPPGKPLSVIATLEWFWPRMTRRQAMPVIRLILEMYALALRNPREFSWVFDGPLRYWSAIAADNKSSRREIDAHATLIAAVVRGLLYDLAVSGDQRRVNSALRQFSTLLSAASR